MSKARQHTILILLSMLMILAGCKQEEEENITTIDAAFTAIPTLGNTTTVFTFDASETSKLGTNSYPVFFRWDWNSDGVFEEIHATKSVFQHRFYLKGDYSILLEASLLNGFKDSASIQIHVDQGYSPPQPKLQISPDSANIYAEFFFDAGQTHDDEDSIETLQFRWDFEGDAIWDTDFSPAYQISHTYQQSGIYQARLEVIDTMRLSTIVERKVIVDLLNGKIKPVLEVECTSCTIKDTFLISASKTWYDGENPPPLNYALDIFMDGIWEFPKSPNPDFEVLFEYRGPTRILLRVFDDRGLHMDLMDTVYVYSQPTPAKLIVPPPFKPKSRK